jgi:hypothetical protein
MLNENQRRDVNQAVNYMYEKRNVAHKAIADLLFRANVLHNKQNKAAIQDRCEKAIELLKEVDNFIIDTEEKEEEVEA